MTKIKGKESIFVLKEKGKKLYFTFDNKFRVVFILAYQIWFHFQNIPFVHICDWFNY